MIFEIKESLLDRLADAKLSDLVCDIMDGHHYIKCTPKIRAKIDKCISENASTTHYELYQSYMGFDIPTNLRKYLKLLDLSAFEDDQIYALVKKQSLLIVENELNEWPVYRHIIHAYTKDRKFGNYYQMLDYAVDKTLTAHTSGGYGQYVQVLDVYDKKYNGVFQYKYCTLFDRDTNDATYFDQNKGKLLKTICGKEINEIIDDDIYTLNQPVFIWHMWYKRAIENYFPVENFKKIGVDISKIVGDSDYFKFDQTTYSKSDLQKLTDGMTYKKYEDNLKHFPYYGESVSEIQLFLLKLLQII